MTWTLLVQSSVGQFGLLKILFAVITGFARLSLSCVSFCLECFPKFLRVVQCSARRVPVPRGMPARRTLCLEIRAMRYGYHDVMQGILVDNVEMGKCAVTCGTNNVSANRAGRRGRGGMGVREFGRV